MIKQKIVIRLTKTGYAYVTKFDYSNAGFSDQQLLPLLMFEFQSCEVTSFHISESIIIKKYINKSVIITISDSQCNIPRSLESIRHRSYLVNSLITEKVSTPQASR